MTVWQKITVATLAAALVFGAWLSRFEMQIRSAGGEGVAATGYVLDRWTGTVHFVAPTFRRELLPPKPAKSADTFIDLK